jgi:hypothetical protein
MVNQRLLNLFNDEICEYNRMRERCMDKIEECKDAEEKEELFSEMQRLAIEAATVTRIRGKVNAVFGKEKKHHESASRHTVDISEDDFSDLFCQAEMGDADSIVVKDGENYRVDDEIYFRILDENGKSMNETYAIVPEYIVVAVRPLPRDIAKSGAVVYFIPIEDDGNFDAY